MTAIDTPAPSSSRRIAVGAEGVLAGYIHDLASHHGTRVRTAATRSTERRVAARPLPAPSSRVTGRRRA